MHGGGVHPHPLHYVIEDGGWTTGPQATACWLGHTQLAARAVVVTVVALVDMMLDRQTPGTYITRLYS